MLADATAARPDDTQFLEAVETMLRDGDADTALEQIRARLAEHCGDGRPLPASVLDLDPSTIDLVGWDRLEEEISQLDDCGEPVTAIAFDLVPTPMAAVEPAIETSFYFDTAWPFSECDRAGLLDGYDANGTAWQSERADIDGEIVSVSGLEPLFNAIRALSGKGDARYASQLDEDAQATGEHVALVAGAYLCTLLHIAVRDKALQYPLTSESMPGGLAILVGAREVEPALRAPVEACCKDSHAIVAGQSGPKSHGAMMPSFGASDELRRKECDEELPETSLDSQSDTLELHDTAVQADDSDHANGHEVAFFRAPGETLDDFAQEQTDIGEEEPASESVATVLDVPRKGLDEVFADPADDPESWHLPPPDIHTTGTQLRRRLVSQDDIEELEASRPRTLLQRLKARFQPA
ncbi:hypothetical protein I5E68_08400 [Novosphingobium sp. YJ-S2-02]|uniref:Uncharacterized protein n=1 Tax=Novosphingobium aureum TaxID=2792964 RepID=A0A931HBY2_9SPHN|nr:hypothetical protein [Novosphingobium aureum]MBH0112969.1 hypothetical protein [Novosphingobium aureum]